MQEINPFAEATWISSRVVGGEHVMAPAPYFRTTFTLDQPVRSASLAITALGLYEAEINGRKVGNHVLSPGWTDYRKRVAYQVYPVAEQLREGENVLGAILGDGWYCGHVALQARQFYGDRPVLLAQLQMVLEDGTQRTIATDSTWKTATGPILENDLLKGEAYDARLELGAWSEPDFAEASWHPVSTSPDPGIILSPGIAPPVRQIEELVPTTIRKVTRDRSEAYIFDLGQNFSGIVRIKVRATRAAAITIRYAEVLEADGSLYTANLRGARATDHYTCRGDETETWEPRFTFHGFRYVEISGLRSGQTVEVRGIVLHSDTPPTGSFECSHPLLNQLQRNIVWGQRSNFLDVPTDCPQRDERLGWTGDAQVFVRTACFNMDVRMFFRKWLQDIRDAQGDDGGIPPVIPDPDVTGLVDGGPAWSDAAVICPWTIYLCYGDGKILEENYGMMTRYLDFLDRQCRHKHIRAHPEDDPGGGFGDWLALDGSGTNEGRTPRDLIGTAFYAYVAGIMMEVSKVLGYPEQREKYALLRREIVTAFQRRFVTPEGLLAGDMQTSYVLALHFDLVPETARDNAVKELVRRIEKNGCHLATGFVGTPYLLDVLERYGRLDVAYGLIEQETFPLWLFPVKNGATTIWERWDGWTAHKGFQSKEMNSFNHYAYGAVGAWMYRTIAGLELDPAEPGFRHIVFRPRPGGSINWAKARLETPCGATSIVWKLEGDKLDVSVEIPTLARATVHAPIDFAPQSLSLNGGMHRLSFFRNQRR